MDEHFVYKFVSVDFVMKVFTYLSPHPGHFVWHQETIGIGFKLCEHLLLNSFPEELLGMF